MSIPPETLKTIGEAMRRPEGTVTFEFTSSDAFRADSPGGLILAIPAGGHYFRLERTASRHLDLYHSSPGTGTRVASIDISMLPSFERAFLVFCWSPSELRFFCGPRDIPSDLLGATGRASPIAYRVGSDGSTFRIGDQNVQIMETRVQHGADVVIAPTALDIWKSTLQAIEVLWSADSSEGFIFEVLQTTTTITMLVTGLESYAKARLLEIESEGIIPNTTALFEAFSSRAVRESARLAELESISKETGRDLLSVIVDGTRINFQSLDHIKKAFHRAFGVKLTDLTIDSKVLTDIRRFIQYRHRIVHVSPLLALLNQDRVPLEEPQFAKRELAEKAVETFRAFAGAFHRATTNLRAEV